jgi:hypothetical protein
LAQSKNPELWAHCNTNVGETGLRETNGCFVVFNKNFLAAKESIK